jgi:hypothetical protein
MFNKRKEEMTVSIQMRKKKGATVSMNSQMKMNLEMTLKKKKRMIINIKDHLTMISKNLSLSLMSKALITLCTCILNQIIRMIIIRYHLATMVMIKIIKAIQNKQVLHIRQRTMVFYKTFFKIKNDYCVT